MLALLNACGAAREKNDVWDQYDIRQPLPYDSQIPDSAAQGRNQNDPYRQNPYIDNDAYYTLPYIQCGIGDAPSCVTD
jgi:hypothetical protein